MKKINIFGVACLTALLMITSCKDDDTMPDTGIIKGNVTDLVNGTSLSEVRIIIFDANTNAPIGTTLQTSADGSFEVELPTGTYYLKLSKQGYEKIPIGDMAPLPITLVQGQAFESDYQMNKSLVTNGGIISGKITTGENPVAGVLVVASNSEIGVSSVTDADGNYVIYNVPPDAYKVKGWMAGYNSDNDDISVTADTETSDVDIALTTGASGSVNGQITFLSTTNIEVDVSLTHPQTRETMPGLSAKTSSQNYSITNVPDGLFLARATYENDTKVIDPDWIIKNGEPFINVSGDQVKMDFSVTGAVSLLAPSNEPTIVQPFEITNNVPEFSWTPYSSASDYVIEVSDANGNVIWGGFDENWTVKKVVISKDKNSVQFNFDGTATVSSLEPNKIYRWRVYASKDDAKEPTGWKLISVSEDQLGLMKLME